MSVTLSSMPLFPICESVKVTRAAFARRALLMRLSTMMETSIGLNLLEGITFPGKGWPVVGSTMVVPLALVAQLPPLKKQLKSPLRSAALGWVLFTGADCFK